MTGTNLSIYNTWYVASGSGFSASAIRSSPVVVAMANATIANAVLWSATQFTVVSFAREVITFAISSVDSLENWYNKYYVKYAVKEYITSFSLTRISQSHLPQIHWPFPEHSKPFGLFGGMQSMVVTLRLISSEVHSHRRPNAPGKHSQMPHL